MHSTPYVCIRSVGVCGGCLASGPEGERAESRVESSEGCLIMRFQTCPTLTSWREEDEADLIGSSDRMESMERPGRGEDAGSMEVGRSVGYFICPAATRDLSLLPLPSIALCSLRYSHTRPCHLFYLVFINRFCVLLFFS